ncbi:MAG: GntR family transcriptional regulator [Alphaproteobacteria bacterium]
MIVAEMADAAPGLAPELARVENLTLQERVYRALREAIMAGRFQPGQTLTVRLLAEALGTSAMPVREAVRQLAAERALDMLANRSVQVPLLSRARFDELWHARALVEGEAAALAATEATAEERARIVAHNDALMAALGTGVGETARERNRAFHFAVYAAAHNAVLLPIIESLWLQWGPSLAMGYHRHSALGASLSRSTRRRHGSLVDALSRGDAAAARAAMAGDIADAARLFAELYDFTAGEPRRGVTERSPE